MSVLPVLARKVGEPYPYSPRQHIGFAILFGPTCLALVVVCLRVYNRITIKQWGIG